ncbi:fumble-domain-containing protein [Xylaria arbuscula]|nr:fumble-domain-containing protein [Xylaria arbuscula]
MSHDQTGAHADTAVAAGDDTEHHESLARPRAMTSTAEIDSTISHPGSVRINVKGAFIVDGTEQPATPANGHVNATNANNGSYHEGKDIRLPNHTAVVSHIAVDIGGSLAKLVYFSREAHSTEPGGRLNFHSFETDRVDDCIEFMRHLKDNQLALNGSKPKDLCIMTTGGGAFKYHDRIKTALGVDVLREDEMACLIIGLDFFITEIPREVFTYSEAEPMQFVQPETNIYPYMLVNIGSGVSILKVSGPRNYERVGGTSLGGGTLWGLLSLLTSADSFDDMLDMAAQGDNAKVDMLVGDIYGTDYNKIGLKSTAIASSFGKVFRMKREAENEAEDNNNNNNPTHHPHQPNQQIEASPSVATPSTQKKPQTDASSRFAAPDISRSLLYAISNNIGQIAYLHSHIHGLSHIYFGGSFIRGHPQTMNTLSYAIRFWSKGSKQAYFLRHEGYLGAVGAFLNRQPHNWGRRGSFDEDGAAFEDRLRARTSGRGDEEMAF